MTTDCVGATDRLPSSFSCLLLHSSLSLQTFFGPFIQSFTFIKMCQLYVWSLLWRICRGNLSRSALIIIGITFNTTHLNCMQAHLMCCVSQLTKIMITFLKNTLFSSIWTILRFCYAARSRRRWKHYKRVIKTRGIKKKKTQNNSFKENAFTLLICMKDKVFFVFHTNVGCFTKLKPAIWYIHVWKVLGLSNSNPLKMN